MSYQRFEEVPVWQDAIVLAEEVDDFTRSTEKGLLTFSQRDQIERASLSVSNNIAEGFESGTVKEKIRYLHLARASAGETRSMLRFFSRRPYLKPHHATLQSFIPLAESCSKQLTGWIKHLRN